MVNIFGGTGFIGSHYAKMYSSVINDRSSLVPVTDEVLYLISTTDNYNVFTDPYVDIDTNLTHLIRVLENCKGKNLTFNFASSWFVYGNVPAPGSEDSLCDPIGFYSITKRAAEQLLITYCKTFNIKYRILRFANVIGPGDKKASSKKNVLTFLVQRLINNQPIQLANGGNFYRDYIHASDLCRAVNLVMEKGELNQIYNIGNSKPILFKDAVLHAKTYFGSTSMVEYTYDVDQKPVSFYMSCDKLAKLGYEPLYTTEKIIEELVDSTKYILSHNGDNTSKLISD